MLLKKTNAKNNPYGFDTVEILEFNYDGEGSALVKNDGEFDSYCKDDINCILFGEFKGTKYYESFKLSLIDNVNELRRKNNDNYIRT